MGQRPEASLAAIKQYSIVDYRCLYVPFVSRKSSQLDAREVDATENDDVAAGTDAPSVA